MPDRDRVAVISHAFWAARFNQDATTVGQYGSTASGHRVVSACETGALRLTAGRQSEESA